MPKILFCLSLFTIISHADATSYLLRLKAENPKALQHYLEEEGYDVAGANKNTGEVSVVTAYPFRIFVEQTDLAQNEELRFTILSQEKTESFLSYNARENADDINGYYGVKESVDALKKLEQKFPQWVKLYNLNDLVGAKKTEEGNAVFGIQVSLNPQKIEDEPKILIIGQHHAREVTTQHAVLDNAEDFLSKASRGDAATLKALQTKAIWFVPVLNPDGLNHVLKEDRMWRKNRSHNADGTRGVDLNRNYGFKWGTCGTNSASPESEVFKGFKPNSEPEILLMDALNQKLHFQFSVSYHSYGNEVLNPYLCGNLAEQEAYFRMRDLFTSTLGFGKRPPSSSGEDHEYHYNKFGTFAFLLEIGEEFQPPFSTYANEIRPTVLKVLPIVLEKGFERTRKIQVVDADTGAPLQALLGVDKVSFKEGEIRTTDNFGSYYWDLPQGNVQISAQKDGYELLQQDLGMENSTTVLKLKKTRFGLNSFSLLAKFFTF